MRARLKSRGDWDLGVFDAKTQALLAGSAAFRGNEVAEGFVTKGQRLLVQACRFAAARRRGVGVRSSPRRASRRSGRRRSSTSPRPTRADKRRLQTLGLDLTENGDADSIEVVLYGDAGRRRSCSKAKFRYTVRDRRPRQARQADRRADRRYAARAAQAGSALPSGAPTTATWPTTSSS